MPQSNPINSCWYFAFVIFIEVFPDVTICNVNPVGSVGFRETLSWTQYISHVDDLAERWSVEDLRKLAPNITSEDYDQLWTYLSAPIGYFKSLDSFDDTTIQSMTDESGLVVDCNVYNWDWTPNNDIQCRESIAVKWNPSYYKCFTLQVPSNERQVSCCYLFSTCSVICQSTI